MEKLIIKEKKKKKKMMVRFLEWIIRGQKKAVENSALCKS